MEVTVKLSELIMQKERQSMYVRGLSRPVLGLGLGLGARSLGGALRRE